MSTQSDLVRRFGTIKPNRSPEGDLTKKFSAPKKNTASYDDEDVGDLSRSGEAIREKIEEPGFIEGLKSSARRQLSDPMAYVAGLERGANAWSSGGVSQIAALLNSLKPGVDYAQALRDQKQIEKEDFENYPLLTYPTAAVGTFTAPLNKLGIGGTPSVLKTAINAAGQTAIERAISGDLRNTDKNLEEGAAGGFAIGGAIHGLPSIAMPVAEKIGKGFARILTRSSPEAIEDYLKLDKATRKAIGNGEIQKTHEIAQDWENQLRNKEYNLSGRDSELSKIVSNQPGKIKGQDLRADLEDELERFTKSREGVINNPEDANYISWLNNQIDSLEAPEHAEYQKLLESAGPENVISYKENPRKYDDAPTFNEISQSLEDELLKTKKGISKESTKSFEILDNNNVSVQKKQIINNLQRYKSNLRAPTQENEAAKAAIDATIRRIKEYPGRTIRGGDLKELIQSTQAKAGFDRPQSEWALVPEKVNKDLQSQYNEILKKDPEYRRQMEKVSDVTDFYNRATRDKLLPLEEGRLTSFLPKLEQDETGRLRKSQEYLRELGRRTERDYLGEIELAGEAKRVNDALQKAGYTTEQVKEILSKANVPSYPQLSPSRVFEMLPEARAQGVEDIFEKRLATPEYLQKRGEFSRLEKALEEQKGVSPNAAGIENIGKTLYAPSKAEGSRPLTKLTEYDTKNATDWAKRLQMSALASHFKGEGTAGSRSVQALTNAAGGSSGGTMAKMMAVVGAVNDIYGKAAVRKGLDAVAEIERIMSTGNAKQALDMIRRLPKESVARELVNNFFPPEILDK